MCVCVCVCVFIGNSSENSLPQLSPALQSVEGSLLERHVHNKHRLQHTHVECSNWEMPLQFQVQAVASPDSKSMRTVGQALAREASMSQ